MNKLYLGYLLTILSALAFASMSLFIKMAYAMGMNPWNFSAIQSSVALLLLGALIIAAVFVSQRESNVGEGSLDGSGAGAT